MTPLANWLLRTLTVIIAALLVRDGYAGASGLALNIPGKGYFAGRGARVLGVVLVVLGVMLLYVAWRGFS